MLSYELKEHYKTIQKQQRNRARKIGHNGYDERIAALSQLKKMLIENENLWLDALQQDLGKHPVEAYASELALLLNELEFTGKSLVNWMKPTHQNRLLLTGKEAATVSRYPYGSILILSPWNYPLQLSLMPVIGALAAGNSCFLKPSEFAAATSHLLAELVPRYLSAEILQVVEGDEEVAKYLTAMQWDFISFTGSQQVGKKVYQAAAEHLTPVLLELGGKNPCIIDEASLTEDTIEQIAWGKFLNAGQSCIAPDTVYVPRSLYGEFLGRMKVQIQRFYGTDSRNNPDYGRISHAKHFDKLMSFLSDGTIYYGGQTLKEERFFSPTLLVDVKEGSKLMSEEVFGPILPVVPYDSLEEVVAHLQDLPTPLVVYLFSSDENTIEFVENELESGAFSLNEVITYAASSHLPFGGKGSSGMGRYHGLASYQTFSYQRTHYTKKPRFSLRQQYPPYSKKGVKALRKLRKRIF